MRGKGRFICFLLMFSLCSLIPKISHAGYFHPVNARSAIVYDMATGKVLYEQNADALIPPASLTKILTLYLTWQAIESGQISLSDRVRVSRQAASMPDVRMGLKVGDIVTVAQLIRGMAIESGNDAAVAMAQHISGSVARFVAKMNAKARKLGMTSSHFCTPNGLPARGQLTTARDILRLSIAYLRRYSGSLWISSMRSYTYHGKTDHNPNNLLGVCPGVDGLKTGFVCASGFNIVATAIRDHVRIIAVVLGAQSPGIRRIDAESLIEAAYHEIGGPYYAVGSYGHEASVPTTAISHEEAACRPLINRRAPRRSYRRVTLVRRKHAARRRALLPSYKVRMRRLRANYEARRRRMRASYEARRRALLKRGRHRASSRRVRARIYKVGPRGRGVRPPARLRRIGRKRVVSHQRKVAHGYVARTREHATRHRAILSRHISKRRRAARDVHSRRTFRANATKASARARRARYNRRKSANHRRANVKTAIKRKRSGARHAREDNRRVG